MKRKILLTAIISYIMLILIILVLGLNHKAREAKLITGSTPRLTVQKPGEGALESTKTAVGLTQTSIESTTHTPETELSQSPNPYEASTITEVLEIPTQTEPTSPTSTSEAYPINGDPAPTATSQPYPVEDSTDATFTPTFTPSPTPTPETQTGWAGEWTVFWEQPDGGFIDGLMLIDLDGSDLTAAVTIGQEDFLFEGILNQNMVTAVGSWSGSGESGSFYWETSNGGLFSGNLDRELGFCGIRGGEDRPEPCIEIPSGK